MDKREAYELNRRIAEILYPGRGIEPFDESVMDGTVFFEDATGQLWGNWAENTDAALDLVRQEDLFTKIYVPQRGSFDVSLLKYPNSKYEVFCEKELPVAICRAWLNYKNETRPG